MSKEIILASEEVSRRNVLACVEHSNITRKIVRDLEEKIKKSENLYIMLQREVVVLRSQLAVVQGKLYVGGT